MSCIRGYFMADFGLDCCGDIFSWHKGLFTYLCNNVFSNCLLSWMPQTLYMISPNSKAVSEALALGHIAMKDKSLDI